jgi:hypothetical protein
LSAIGEQSKKRDVGFLTDLRLKERATPDGEAEILSEYIHMVCLPSFRDPRSFHQVADENVVGMPGCASQLDLLREGVQKFVTCPLTFYLASLTRI